MSVITPSDLQTYLGLTAINTTLAQECIDATEERLAQRCELPEVWTKDITMAAKIQASRLYKRPQNIEGAIGFEGVGVIRISRFDPDVEDLLSNWLKVGFA